MMMLSGEAIKQDYIKCTYRGKVNSSNVVSWNLKEIEGDLFFLNSSGVVELKRDAQIEITAHVMWYNGNENPVYLNVNGINEFGGASGAINGYTFYGIYGYVVNAKKGDRFSVDTFHEGINRYQEKASYLIVKEL